jgi:hypothetical protein
MGDGAITVESVRQDIYCFSTGRIVNLPEAKLTKTVLKLCQDIISEKAPILPPGYHPTSIQEAELNQLENDGNMVVNYKNDPYLQKIKMRSVRHVSISFRLKSQGSSRSDVFSARLLLTRVFIGHLSTGGVGYSGCSTYFLVCHFDKATASQSCTTIL